MRKSLPSFQLLGKQGEDFAASYLISKGYTILRRNFRVRYGEIDIIAIFHDTLVFVEVKTRSNDYFGQPEEAISHKKLTEIIKTSQIFKENRSNLPDLERIDVIAIKMHHNGTIIHINHIENVTGFL